MNGASVTHGIILSSLSYSFRDREVKGNTFEKNGKKFPNLMKSINQRSKNTDAPKEDKNQSKLH